MAATVVRRRVDEPFDIHEDARTEETEMMVEDDIDHLADDTAARAAATDEVMDQAEEEAHDQEDEEDEESSEDEQIESSVQADMDKLGTDFPGFRGKYRLVKRIGEGVFSLLCTRTTVALWSSTRC